MRSQAPRREAAIGALVEKGPQRHMHEYYTINQIEEGKDRGGRIAGQQLCGGVRVVIRRLMLDNTLNVYTNNNQESRVKSVTIISTSGCRRQGVQTTKNEIKTHQLTKHARKK